MQSRGGGRATIIMTQSKMHWGQKSSGKKKREIEKLHCIARKLILRSHFLFLLFGLGAAKIKTMQEPRERRRKGRNITHFRKILPLGEVVK